MPNPNTPGVQINEVRLGAPPIAGVGTSTAGFVGAAPKAGTFPNVARLVTSRDQFLNNYVADATRSTPLSRAVLGFFANGGSTCYVVNVDATSATATVAGIKLLELEQDVNIIAAPGHTEATVYQELEDQASRNLNRFAILDPPSKVDDIGKLKKGGTERPVDSIFAAFYYPRVLVAPDLSGDPAPDSATPEFVTPTGHIAGAYANTDGTRGVHKAPANLALRGVLGVEHRLTDSDQNSLNDDGVNLLRIFSDGTVVWGARTLLASDAPDKTYRYVNVRRLVGYVEESLREGLRFAVFEPNNLALRQIITRSVRGFLDGVWRDGALFGATPDEAYYVRFPELANSDVERALGKLTIEIGLRATFPAEFIIVRIGVILQSAATA